MKIRVDIRDQIDSTDGAVQRAINQIKDIVGFPVTFNIDWAILWNELQGTFPEKGEFVPHVAALIVSWCDTLQSLLKDEQREQWTEEFLEKVDAGTINLCVLVSSLLV
jgi:hypothetical protein